MIHLNNRAHATCIAYNKTGLLLKGESGVGKSDLTLRFIYFDQNCCTFIADDQVQLSKDGHQIIASSIVQTKGMLEVRGVGIVQLPYMEKVEVKAVIDLSPQNKIERFPCKKEVKILGEKLPLFFLKPFEASSLEKLILICKILDGEVKLVQ